VKRHDKEIHAVSDKILPKIPVTVKDKTQLPVLPDVFGICGNRHRKIRPDKRRPDGGMEDPEMQPVLQRRNRLCEMMNEK